MIECWLPVPGYEGFYEVSDLGRVYSFPRLGTSGGILSPGWTGTKPKQYLTVGLCLKYDRRFYKVHHLVLSAFTGDRPKGLLACHIDDDTSNNCLDNLKWDTPSGNMLDRVRNGTHPGASKLACKNGHEFTPENTYIDAVTGKRSCRVCRTAAVRRSRERRSRS